MNPLQDLLDALAGIADLDAEGRAALAQQIAETVPDLNADELTELESALMAVADPLLEDLDSVDDDGLAVLDLVSNGKKAITARTDELAEADEARRSRAADLARDIRGAGPDDDPDGDDPDAEDPDEEPAEGEPAPAEAEAEPVAASGNTAAQRAARRKAAAAKPPAKVAGKVTRVAARGMAAIAAKETPPAYTPPTFAERGLVASASGAGLQAGAALTAPEQLAQLLMAAWSGSKGTRVDGQLRIPVARVGNGDASVLYGNDINGTHRYLDRDTIANYRKVAATCLPEALGVDPATGARTLVAAGGICAPIEPSYEMRTVGSAARPVRDALVRFGADRGGIRTMPGPVITDLNGALGVWTEANDQNPSSPATKPCLTITCPDDTETLIEALTFCLQTGNFRQRFFPEQIEAWLSLRDIARARQAENRLLARIEAASVAVHNGDLAASAIVGLAKDIPTWLEKLAMGYRFRMRAPEQRFQVIAPFWLKALWRTDLARELAHGTYAERMVVADATIESALTSRGLNPSWHLDGTEVFGAQGTGAIVAYPDAAADPATGTQVDVLMFPEGAWLWLDGGQLDLGIIRDSTLVSTNDFQMFTEAFEGSHFVGAPYESWRVRLTVCANGATGAAVAVTNCG